MITPAKDTYGPGRGCSDYEHSVHCDGRHAPATAQHTPGPWRAMDDGYIVAEDGEGCLIAKVEDENAAGPAIVVADARLIAAAPDLLAALDDGAEIADELVGSWESGDLAGCVRMLDLWRTSARAAIRKARGE